MTDNTNIDDRQDLGGMAKPMLASLCTEIHASNLVAGWWTNLKTGESILATRNRPEMLMLAVSELAEAAEGLDYGGRPDDKLPHLPMFDVELADFVIRQLDQIGAEVSLGATMPVFEAAPPFTDARMRCRTHEGQLMLLVRLTSSAMEDYRKGRVEQYVCNMANGVRQAFAIARIHDIDLLDVIAQKRAYNATRDDHQIANRQQAGGKAF